MFVILDSLVINSKDFSSIYLLNKLFSVLLLLILEGEYLLNKLPIFIFSFMLKLTLLWEILLLLEETYLSYKLVIESLTFKLFEDSKYTGFWISFKLNVSSVPLLVLLNKSLKLPLSFLVALLINSQLFIVLASIGALIDSLILSYFRFCF